LCRLQLEQLEDRLTPSVNFFPLAHLAINPAPLPLLALVEFDPLPKLDPANPVFFDNLVTGVHYQKVNLLVQIGNTSSPQAWTLETIFSLVASGTESLVPPNPLNAGSYSATFSIAGSVTEILAPVAPTTGATWVFNDTVTEDGNLNGVISPPDPATGISQLSSTFTQTGMETGTWIDVGVPVFSAPDARKYHAVFQSAGNLMQIVPPNGVPTTASFMQQDVVTACYMPVTSPLLPPGPCITISAVINSAGSVTDNVFDPSLDLGTGSGINRLQVDTGMTQYTDSLTETITFADGSVRFFTESSQNSGIFIIAILVG
jgi:hypothetical protein